MAERLATAASFVDHVIVCPFIVLPFASFTVAVSVVLTFCAIERDDGDTVTDPTGIGTTVTVAVPLTVPLVAVIVALPGSNPVTTPD